MGVFFVTGWFAPTWSAEGIRLYVLLSWVFALSSLQSAFSILPWRHSPRLPQRSTAGPAPAIPCSKSSGTLTQLFIQGEQPRRAYLIGGSLGAISAIIITSSNAHKAAGIDTFTNATISLLMLASAWLLAAAMAYRSVRNRRYESIREWMIRSYVLVWSFVFCRLASRVPGVQDMGGGEAFICLSWVGLWCYVRQREIPSLVWLYSWPVFLAIIVVALGFNRIRNMRRT